MSIGQRVRFLTRRFLSVAVGDIIQFMHHKKHVVACDRIRKSRNSGSLFGRTRDALSWSTLSVVVNFTRKE
jgi:hypothetical protein